MTLFSANLGFLWPDLALPDRVRAAKAAGFDAVECHWPYDTPAADVAAALAETGLKMLGLNTDRGNLAAGENGLAALVGREGEARAAIDQGLDYGRAIGAANLHVMCGFASGPAAHDCFVENLTYACEQAQKAGMSILIEPLNRHDAPGYFLSMTGEARRIITEVNAPNLRLMFDCYHVQRMEGDLSQRLEELLPLIGHIQFASVPERRAPDQGEVAYGHVFKVIRDLGYTAPLGAEYKPEGATEDSLGWMETLGAPRQ